LVYLEAVYQGIGFIFHVTTKDVQPGEELISNYGDDYDWDIVQNTKEKRRNRIEVVKFIKKEYIVDLTNLQKNSD
jgi:cystathionine beta-lyase family protein involved in aluminum resistance